MTAFGNTSPTVSVSVSDRVTGGTMSKGNQIKWYRDGCWYKADFLGYEGLAEHICSALLRASSIKNYVVYEMVIINEVDSKENFIGCKSDDFPATGVFHSIDTLLFRLPEKYNVFLEPRQTLKESIHDFSAGIEKYFNVDIINDIINMLAFDLLVGNEDRHLLNFGLIEDSGEFVFAPLFDHGLSLLSDLKSDTQHSCIDEIVYKPFGYSRKGGRGLDSLAAHPLSINMVQFYHAEKEIRSTGIYSKSIIDRAMSVLNKSMTETEGILWMKG